MSSDDKDAGRVVQRVLMRAISDGAYRRALLQHPNDLVLAELVRSGVPNPKIRFDAVEDTATTWVLRVPVADSERSAQAALKPLFDFVNSAGKAELDGFLREPRPKLKELLGVEFQQDIHVVVRIEAPGERVLVVPQDAFDAVGPGPDHSHEAAKIKLCPKGVTIDLCPKDVTVDMCPKGITVVSCPCTISSTDTGNFCTIHKTLDEVEFSPDVSSPDSMRKLSDLLDE